MKDVCGYEGLYTVSNFAGDMQEERATEAWNRRSDNG